MDAARLTDWLAFLSDAMLAVAVLYVTWQALRGWRKEARAESMRAGADRNAALADARTFYALATLSEPWVLLLLFIGTLIKAGLGLYGAPWWV